MSSTWIGVGITIALTGVGCRDKPHEQSAAPVVGSAEARPVASPPGVAAAGSASSSSSSTPTIEAAIAHAAAAHKPLLLEFSTDWCKPCKIFEQTTLIDPRVKSALAGVELVRYDAEVQPGVAAAMRYTVTSYPTFVGVDARGELSARSTGTDEGEAGVHQFLGFIARVESSSLGEPELKAKLAAAPNDAALRLAAGRWYADHGRAAEAKAQYDAVGTSATAAERDEAAMASARVGRIARWKQELVAELLERARRVPTKVDDHELAIATIDSGAAPAAIHTAFANVFAAQTDPGTVNGMLYVALAAGAVDEALAAGKRALGDSKDPQQLDTLAECYHVHGDQADALRIEDQAIALAKGPLVNALGENRKRFATGHGDSDDVAQLHAQVARTWKQLAHVDDAEAAGAQPAGDAMPPSAMAAMAAFGAARKLGEVAGTACASVAGKSNQAFAQVALDGSGKVTAATLYLDDGASPALRACLSSHLVGASLPVAPGFPMQPIEIKFKAAE